MNKETQYSLLILKHRKDGTFSLAELAQWIEDDEGITYSAARSKAGRLVNRIPCESLSRTVFKLTHLPDPALGGHISLKKPRKPKETSLEKVNFVADIITYLNLKAKTAFKGKPSDVAKINARINEGHTLEEFRIVIEKKCAEWIGTEHEKYLRPETLFGTKFEGYLNQKINSGGKVEQMGQFDFNKYVG